jgi:translocation and assembly module TamB
MPVRGVPLTPEQRAERNAARRALARRVALRSSLGTLAVLAVTLLLAWWLLQTLAGRDLLLRQIVARLPEGTTLTWERAEGPAAGPLVLHGVRFRHAGADASPGEAIVFTARTVALDPALRPLLGRRLRLDGLAIREATLELPRSDKPFELPRWPESLPRIEPPLALQADAFRVDDLRITRDGVPLATLGTARGGLDAARGRLHVERWAVASDRGVFTVHGDYVPHAEYRTDLVATAVLPAPAGRTAPRLGLVARGDLARMDVALAGRAPAPVRATVTLRAPVDRDQPRWQARASSEAFDPALVAGTGEPGTPWTFDLQADGHGGRAQVAGRVAIGALRATIRPSQLTLEEQVLTVAPLVVDVFDGRATLRGRADLRDPDTASLRFAVNARGLTWRGGEGAAGDAPTVVADGDFGIAGRPEAWAAVGNARFARDGQQADVRFDGRGNRERVVIRSLRATMPTGTLEATGTAGWTPRLAWDLDARLAGFDPGYFFPDWPGAVHGRIATRGTARADGGVDATFDAPRVEGRLRGRPLAGNAHVALRGDAIDGNVALALGTSRVEARGRIGRVLDVDARFAPLHLADLWPGAGGTLQGTLALRGPRTSPDIDADLDGRDLRWNAYRASALQAHGRLPWRGRDGALVVEAQGLQAGLAFDTVRIDARGAFERLQLAAQARGASGTLALQGDATKRGQAWHGTLASLRVAPVRGAAWTLRAPTQFRWDGRNGALTQACLAADGGGALCARGDWPRHGLDIAGTGLPATLLVPWLPARTDGRPWLLRGEFALDGQVRPRGNAWRAHARVSSAGGGLRNSERARTELVSYRDLVLEADIDPQRLDARLGAVVYEDGRLDARLRTGWDAHAPLAGDIALDTDELTWMELFSPDIVAPTGRLAGRITLGGTRAQPALGGQAQLSGFSTELPALALTVRDGQARLDARADGTARITGSLRSGEGTLAIDGTLGWRGDDAPLVLNVRGSNVLASDTRDLRAVVDPDVVVRRAAGQPLAITGTVGVPSARIDLERLDRGVAASPDVVVLDPADPERALATPLDLDLVLALGDDVRLSGFGLDGTLAGRLRVRERPGREMTAHGSLDVAGRYTAYGQKLTITRGELNWANGPIANPLLDIRAEREVADVTAGIQVTGRATAPQAEVWAEPAMDESEALAYLALGRPLASASDAEGRQLDAASAALSAGGSLLASQLGARIGLDDAGVVQSRALGGSVFGVGKYLSPKLYVGYGVSLLGTGQVLTLKYLLRKGFDIEIESSTLENRASVNWRKER